VKVRIVAAGKEGFEEWTNLCQQSGIICRSDLSYSTDSTELEDELKNDAPPDVVLCHANDLNIQGIYRGEYLAHCTSKGVHVLLFSGSGVVVDKPEPNRVKLKTDEVETEIAGCKSELIHDCQINISKASDFFIEEALAAVRENKESGGAAPAVVFVHALIGFNLILEQKLCLLYDSLNLEQLKRFSESKEYKILLQNIADKSKQTVENNVAQLLKGSGERVALIRELRDVLLASE
jgi:hypothetical protein